MRRFLLVVVVLAIGGLVREAQSPPPDNVTHRPATCQRIAWSTTAGQYVTSNYSPPGGGGCK